MLTRSASVVTSVAAHGLIQSFAVPGPDGVVVHAETYTAAAGEQACTDLLDSTDVTAILAGNDMIAVGCYAALDRRGLSCPADVSLVVWGEHGIDAYAHATLPRIAYPVDEIARRTARLLLARLAGSSAPPRVEVCATAFVPGAAAP